MPSIFDAIGSFFGSSAAMPIALTGMGIASYYGNQNTAQANIEAARISAQGQLAQAQAIEAGNRLAQARFNAIQQQTAPAQSYLRGVVVQDPTRLTAFQANQLADLRRRTQQGLAVSGLRGSGRSQVAAFRRVEDVARNRMIDSNRARQTNAAGALSAQYGNAATNAAKLDASTGRAVGGALATIGENNSQVGTANVENRGKMIGDIGSLFASEIKDRTRASQYDTAFRRRTDQSP